MKQAGTLSERRQRLIAAWLDERDAIRSSRTRLGLRGYAYLAAILSEKPMAVRELGHAAGLGHVAAYRCVMSLHALKMAHIIDWRLKRNTPALPIFAFGPGEDVPPPTTRPDGRAIEAVNMPKRRLCAAVIAFAHLMRAVDEPRRRLDLIDETGLNKDTVQGWMDACLELELVHIACWHLPDQGGPAQPMLQFGAGINAKKPRVDKKERRERHRDRARMRRSFAPLLAAFGPAANEERRAA